MLKWGAISKTFPDFGPRKNKDKPQTKLALVAGRVSQVAKTSGGGGNNEAGETMPTMGLLAPPRAKRYRLSEFAVRDLIGRGAFSEVSLARHIFEEQHYALKIYKKSEIASSVKILRLVSEIEILRVAKHPFILPLRATFQDPRRIYLMFEFCQGGELHYHLRNNGTFKEDFVRFYLAEIVLAIGYLHEYGIVHRGIRPESVLFSSSGHVRLVGFDYAKKVIDRTFTLCGTPDYVAPEMLSETGYSYSVDWWALGVMAFEMLFGYPPFFDKSPFLIYQKIAKGSFTFGLSASNAVRLSPIHQMISKLLKVDRKKRLGCGRHGVEEVKQDRFFGGDSLNWRAVYEQQIVPPWVPELSGEADCRYLKVLSRMIDVDTAGEVEGEALKMFRAIDEGERRLPPPTD
jgi:serine/threonine protein kinase